MKPLHHWFRTPLGQALLTTECRLLTRRLANTYARTILQIGAYGRGQRPGLFGDARQWLVDDWPNGPVDIAADSAELPFLADSMDAVLLVHQLEFSPTPHDLLREASRVVAAEGRLIVLAFNPMSLWGVRRLLAAGSGRVPWTGRYLGRSRLEDWLKVLGLEIERRDGLMLRPPIRNRTVLDRLTTLENGHPGYARWFGGVHMTIARKRVAGTNPLLPRERPRLAVIPGGLAQASSRSRLNDPR